MSRSQQDHPSKRAADLQARLRRLTPLLRRGEAYHVEMDAIARELGELSMSLESYDPSCHAWRAEPRKRSATAASLKLSAMPGYPIPRPGRPILHLKGSHDARDA